MPAHEFDLDLALGAEGPLILVSGASRNLDRQETRPIPGGLARPRREARITQPFEDKISIQSISPSDLRN